MKIFTIFALSVYGRPMFSVFSQKKNMRHFFYSLLFLTSTFFTHAESHQTPSSLNGEVTKSGESASAEKEKMLWFDAKANFSRFSTKEAIRLFLDKTKDTGFNKIVVDVKPVEGDALYNSEILTRATTLGDQTVERDWDYLQFFIDEAHKRGLKVTVSTTIFTMGSPHIKQGPAYRDSRWEGKTCLQYKPEGMVDIKDDPSKVGAFLNPILPEVQEFALSFIKELVTNYDFDGYALDYCRFPDYQSDFSPASREAFERYIDGKVNRWPEDIFTYNPDGSRNAGIHYEKWWEFRSMVIRDFVSDARKVIKTIKPDIQFEYWAASWWGALHSSGQNWANPNVDPSSEPDYHIYYSSWCSADYKKTGFADQLDVFLLGAYLSIIYGADDNESIEYAIARAKRLIGDACTLYGTVDCSNGTFDIEEASYYCLTATSGLMVFDIVHVINNNKWDDIKKGIQRYERENSAQRD